MSLSHRPDLGAGEIYVNFNQNVTSLAVADKSGYSLYSLSCVDNCLDKIYCCLTEQVYVVERLFESSLVVVVGHESPRTIKIVHFKKKSEICCYTYSSTILAVKLNRERIVVCLEESLFIHNIQDMSVLHTINGTPCNSAGIFALSSCSDNCYLAYPGSITTGEVQIFDAINLNAKTMISAHDSPLAALVFSRCGKEIATASERGTVIRVFSALDGTKLFELRRGLKRCVAIASLSFSTCGEYLVSSSNTETVHIFRLGRTKVENNDTKQSSDDWMGYSFFRYLSKTVTSYLPTQVTDVFSQGRAFASVTLPEPNIKRICGISKWQKQSRLLIASQDGYLYVYSIPTVEGAECQLIKRHDLRLEHCTSIDSKAKTSPSAGAAAAADDSSTNVTEKTNISPGSAGAASTKEDEKSISPSNSNAGTEIESNTSS